MDEALTQELKPTVTKVSNRAAANWRIISADDIEQELWMFIMSSVSIQDYLDKGNSKQRWKALSLQADSICHKEQLDYERFTGNWFYTPREAKALLTRMYGAPHEGQQIRQEEAIDVDRALKKMEASNPHYYKVIQEFFVHGTYERYEENDKKRLRRAIVCLSDTMNISRNTRQAEYDKNRAGI